MSFKCPKRPFRDEIAAKLALASIQKRDGSRREAKECRVYRCTFPNHRGKWHTTSQPLRTSVKVS